MTPAISTSFGRSQLYRIPEALPERPVASTVMPFTPKAALLPPVPEPAPAPEDSFLSIMLTFAAILIGVVAIVTLRIGLYTAGHSEMPVFRQLLLAVGLGS
jgi:hypothetical protein